MVGMERKRTFIYYWSGEAALKGFSSEFEGVGFMFKFLSPNNRKRVIEGLQKGIIPLIQDGCTQPRLECVEGDWTAYGYPNTEAAVGHFAHLNDYALGQIVDQVLETFPNPLNDALLKIKEENDDLS